MGAFVREDKLPADEKKVLACLRDLLLLGGKETLFTNYRLRRGRAAGIDLELRERG